MAWRIIEVPDEQAQENDLTDSEFIGMRILMEPHVGEPENDNNVYWRAIMKIYPQSVIAGRKWNNK
jgi:hypothetical protein